MYAQSVEIWSMRPTSSRPTGGNFAKLFDVQNKRFTTITCTRCGYTELYKEMSDGAMDVLDFLIGG